MALDGGGIRGAFTLGFLGKLESLIARETDKGKDFALADYFDFIGGTSTATIIAAGLSLGWTVEKLTSMYREFGAAVGCSSSGGALVINSRTATVNLGISPMRTYSARVQNQGHPG